MDDLILVLGLAMLLARPGAAMVILGLWFWWVIKVKK